MPDTKQKYHQKSYAETAEHLNSIKHVANTLSISTQSIFGAMVEEHHDYSDRRFINMMSDASVEEYTKFNHGIIQKLYSEIKDPNSIHSIFNKAKNPILNDVSPFNIKIATAITLINKYNQDYLQNDPLDLKKYTKDYGLLAKDMVLNEHEVSPKLSGLMLKEAKDYFDKHITDKAWWNQQDQAYKDAVYITYYNVGPNVINKKYQQTIAKGEVYHPAPGDGKSAGINHLFNSPEILKYLPNDNYQTISSKKLLFSEENQKSSIEKIMSNPKFVNLSIEDQQQALRVAQAKDDLIYAKNQAQQQPQLDANNINRANLEEHKNTKLQYGTTKV